MKLCAIVAGLALLAGPAFAQRTPAPRPATPAPQTTNPAMAQAEAAFEALPEEARRKIQDDLIWASNFTATTSGQFGSRTFAAIQMFQRTENLPITGILDPGQIRQLAERANRSRAAARLGMQADPRTGASVPIASALFTKRETLPTGTRWESTDGQIVLETGVGQGGAAQLPAAFDRFVTLPTPGRKVTYKLLRPDFFVVTGELGPRSFYVRYAVGPNNLRGYALSYPTARSAELERHVIAIANGFQAVPGQAPAAVAASAPNAQGGNALASTVIATPPVNPNTIPSGLFLTGAVAAPGRVVTASFAAACTDLKVNGKPARILSPGSPSEAALLEADTGTARPLAQIASQEAANSVVLIGFTPGARPSVSVTTGETIAGTGDLRVMAPLHREGGGSLMLDRQGQLLGLVNAPTQAPRLVAGLSPSVSHAVMPARALARHLPSGTVAGSQSGDGKRTRTLGEIAADIAPSLVAISCGQPVTLPKS